MPNYTLRWANRSHSNQDWMINIGDNFHLAPNYVRNVNININHDHTFQIAVSTDGGFAAANLIYTASSDSWSLQSHTPAEWQLASGAGVVTVRCFLEDVEAVLEKPSYQAEIPVIDDEVLKGSYPAYQLYKDDTMTTYCSPKKVKSHVEGREWIRVCLGAHPGTSVRGKPWTSPNQSGTVWP